MDPRAYERLERRSRQTQRKRAELLNTYVDEGLRMEDHPGIVFRSGPVGRRPAVIGGPDVWEVIPVVKNVEGRGEAAVREAAEWLGLRVDQVAAAVGYYAEYGDEIDAWIARNEEEAERFRKAWERRQQALA